MSFPDTDLARTVRAYLKDLDAETQPPWYDAQSSDEDEESGARNRTWTALGLGAYSASTAHPPTGLLPKTLFYQPKRDKGELK